MKPFTNSSALTENRSIKTGNNHINNAINHTPSVTPHHHPPSRGAAPCWEARQQHLSPLPSFIPSVSIGETLDPSHQQTDKRPTALTEAVVRYTDKK